MSIQIFILGKLMEDNNYPYKLKKQLSKPIPLDELGGLTESKLYYHFDSLAKKGLIESVEIIKEENRPDKQVFRITDKGREALPKLIYKLFEDAEEIKDMVVGLANIVYVDRDKVVEILEKKLSSTEAQLQQLSTLGKQINISEDKKKFAEFMGGYISTRTEHTIHWMKELIVQIKTGNI